MKLFIKQNVFSGGFDQFWVQDEAGNDVYQARSKTGVRVGLQLHVLDSTGEEIGYISQKALSLTPTFRVYVEGEQVATIVKKFTFLKPRYEVKELGWTIQGDFLAHDYVVSDDSGLVMTVSKQWLQWGDTFVAELFDEEHALEALAVVFAIDCVMDSDEKGPIDGMT